MSDRHKDLVCQLAHLILDATNSVPEGMVAGDVLPTSGDLAKLTGISPDLVKKKLKILLQMGLIHPISMSPKRYQFERFAVHKLTEDHPLYEDLRNPDSVFYLDVE